MATHSSTLAWKIPWTEEPGGLLSMGSQRVRHDWAHVEGEETISVQCSVMSVSQTAWTAACQAFLFITNSWSFIKFMSIESVMPSNHLILCCPLLLPPIFPSIRVFPKESVLHIRWPKYGINITFICTKKSKNSQLALLQYLLYCGSLEPDLQCLSGMPVLQHDHDDLFKNATCELWFIYTMEYYSAIKKNTFESVLMRCVNLKDIIQSEVSQKEKNKYCILKHIYGI